MRRSFMIAADKEGKIGRDAGAGVVLVEIANGAVFCGDGHGGEVAGVADGLEITADDEEVDGRPVAYTAGLGDGGVDGVEGAVALWRWRR